MSLNPSKQEEPNSTALDLETLPVLVACGQKSDRPDLGDNFSPIEMMAEAALLASQDSGIPNILSSLDTLVATGLTVDAAQVNSPASGLYENVPKSVAQALSISPERLVYTQTGGNTPQRLVNYFAQQISLGKAKSVLLTGGEALNTMSRRFNHWSKFLLPKGKWKDSPGGSYESFGDTKPGNSDYEGRYGMNLPVNVYPLFENALRVHYQRTHAEQREAMGRLFSGLSKTAEDNPHAWFRSHASAEELIRDSESNRFIAYPYTKRLSSMLKVNQSAAVILMSAAKANSLGISEDKWVYLHGYADANDIWNVSERDDFHSSPAMRVMAKSALRMANKNIDDMSFFDIYSCFPSAVQIACDEFGIAHDDSRGLSLTGGLPYFGGPGNNYSMHGIVELMHRARENPNEFGLLNANGWYLTKHSMGIYSKQRPSAGLAVESMLNVPPPKVRLVEEATGKAQLETFTVLYSKDNQPRKSILVAALENGRRCLATTSQSAEVLESLISAEEFRIEGEIVKVNDKNVFEF